MAPIILSESFPACFPWRYAMMKIMLDHRPSISPVVDLDPI
jgi:hypothetical protein